MRRSGFYIALGVENRLIVVPSDAIPPEVTRYRTAQHAAVIAEEFNGDRVAQRVRRDFGGEVTV